MTDLFGNVMGLFGGGREVQARQREQVTQQRQLGLHQTMRANISQNNRKAAAATQEAQKYKRQAIAHHKSGNARAARLAMMQYKRAMQKASSTDSRSFALDTQADALDTATDMRRDFDTMQQTTGEVKGLIRGIDQASVVDMMEDTTEVMTEMNEIQESFNESINFGDVFGSEAEIEAELDDLLVNETAAEQEEEDQMMSSLMREVNGLPDPPVTSLPSRTGAVSRPAPTAVYAGGSATQSRTAQPPPEEDFSEFF